MSKSSCRPGAAAFFASASLALAGPAAAAPTAVTSATVAPAHVRVIETHMTLAAPRSTRAFIVNYAAAPLRFTVHTAPAAPITALPLINPPMRVRGIPAFVPRLGLAALPALAAWDVCAMHSSGVILSALPATPFAPIACERDLSASGNRVPPTPLVPAHNKNALYGRGYTPRSADDL